MPMSKALEANWKPSREKSSKKFDRECAKVFNEIFLQCNLSKTVQVPKDQYKDQTISMFLPKSLQGRFLATEQF